MENTNSTSWQEGRSMIRNLFATTYRTGQTRTWRRLPGRAGTVLLLAAGFCLLIAGQTMATAPSFGDYLYRRSITIDHDEVGDSCGATVSGFPVLVTIESSTSLKKNNNSADHVKNANGYDIVFTDADLNQLNHEVEVYDPDEGTLVAWVNVPTLSSSVDTVIYMYYGDSSIGAATANPTAVWDSNYQGVWHLNQAPTGASGNIIDSTANNNAGQTVNMTSGDRTDNGRIGDALDFDGLDDYINIGDPLASENSETISAWVKHDALPTKVERYVSLGDAGVIRHDGANGVGQVHYYAKDQSGNSEVIRENNALTPGAWYYVVGTWSYPGSTMKLYINGVHVATEGHDHKKLKASGSSKISSSSETMDGIIDEVRVSKIARDACWIQTEYNNQKPSAAFHTLGAEEETDALLPTYIINAAAGANGSIDPAGDLSVEQGQSPIFSLIAADGYEVDTVTIDGGSPQNWDLTHYQFFNVSADASIEVSFKLAPVGAPDVDDTLPAGCSENAATDYSTGFDSDNLALLNTGLDGDHYIKLDTGYGAINPESIVVPFRQQVAVTFMYENAGNKLTDFGWMLGTDNHLTELGDPPHRIIYEDINDNDNNGVLDVGESDPTDRFVDRNGDGVVDVLDNREILGTFDAGTELVFFIKNDNYPYRINAPNPVTGVPVTDYFAPSQQMYHYSKTDWMQSKYTSKETSGHENPCLRAADGSALEKTYFLGLPRTNDDCEDDGWMDQDALDRIAAKFNLNFAVGDTASGSFPWDERWPAVIVGAPGNNLNAWVLAFEDGVGGGDTDHNDVVFIIERETGGTAQLLPAAAITPALADANITGVTFNVWDFMPDDTSGACAGQTEISYWLSIDAGTTWVEVDAWDEVNNFTLVSGEKVLGNPVTNWVPSSPPYTHRSRRVDFAGLGLSGRQLIWHADLKSRREGCEPKVMDMSLNMTASVPGHIARATPTVLANVMFSGSMETPAGDWTSAEMRGHLESRRIYDPSNPDETSSLDLWDAGDYLKNQMAPSDRTIYIPNVTVYSVDSANAELLATGDGVTVTFSGQLAHYPVLATTVRLTDARETFADRRTDVLDGDLGGSGWINRFTGEYRITFDQPPNLDQPITAVYSHFSYNTGGTLRAFTEDAVSAAELGLDDSAAIPSGYTYDFNNDDAFTTADVNWLIDWTRGYADGSAKLVEKEWTLGPVDHSVPAVATPPTSAPFYYGTSFPEDKPNSDNDRKGYRAFRDAQADRRTVVYVGARDGMLHAFDAGDFRWGDNPCTASIVENRGYFQWKDPGDSTACKTSCSVNCQQYYGTGRELWSFIPANLLPRLKNNYLQGDDRAYVDASPALADVYTNGAWRTVLMAAEGNGGDTVYALDVTDPDAPKFMWEFAHPYLFRSRSSPSVAKIGLIYDGGTPKWAAFFVSGKTFDDTLYPSIYTIDIADGSLVDHIVLDAVQTGVPDGAGGVLSGQPTLVDSDGNGYVDRLYIGSDKGLLYKINIPDDPDTVKSSIGHCIINTDFTDQYDASVFDDWHYQPIYGSPTVVSSNHVDITGQMGYDIRIFFGTGDSPYYDEDINFGNTRYLFYAYRDTAAKGGCDDSQVALDWFYELPIGHRIYASAFASAGNIYFGTSTGDTEDPCDISANSDPNFDANAGILYAFDLEGNKKFEKVVGNVLAAPVVEDKHIYVQTVSGDVDSFGSGQYNTATIQGGIPEIEIHWWREMF